MNVQKGKVSTKGQVTIPKDFREAYNIKPGDDVFMIKDRDGILIKKKNSNLRVLRGLLSDEIDLQKAENFINAERRKWRLDDG